jgi:hypothetical protein
MIFSVQRFLEDHFARRGMEDSDQYAVKLANVYARDRGSVSNHDLRSRLRRIRTVFYSRNRHVDRAKLEADILHRLANRFPANSSVLDEGFSNRVKGERAALRRLPRRSIRDVLNSFKRATEARTVDAVWASRKAGRLKSRPEKIAQSLLAQFVLGALSSRGGELLRELASGVGFVDIAVRLGMVQHLVELKILRGPFVGPAQLAEYMRIEGRSTGWLVVFDTRKPARQTVLPMRLETPAGVINVVLVNVNPTPPSRKIGRPTPLLLGRRVSSASYRGSLRARQ